MVPFSSIVVFINTPHQGSEIADIGILRAAARVALFIPKTAKNRIHALMELPSAIIHPSLRAFHDWGIDGAENLSPRHPFFKALAQRPITVPFHSIIATHNLLAPRLSGDGVVRYSSAHLKGSVSEDLVPYGHGSLEKPLTVNALMHILHTEF